MYQLPRIVLCAPGNWLSTKEVEKAIDIAEIEYRIGPALPNQDEYFQLMSGGSDGDFTPDELQALKSHKNVIYASTPRYVADDTLHWLMMMNQVASGLIQLEAAGVRSVNSSISHPIADWKSTMADLEKATRDFASEDKEAHVNGYIQLMVTNVRNFVHLALRRTPTNFILGAHLLSEPGAVITDEVAAQAFPNSSSRWDSINGLFRAFLGELMFRNLNLRTGDVYTNEETGTSFRLEHVDDATAFEDEDCRNPFGMWRFAAVVDSDEKAARPSTAIQIDTTIDNSDKPRKSLWLDKSLLGSALGLVVGSTIAYFIQNGVIPHPQPLSFILSLGAVVFGPIVGWNLPRWIGLR